MGNRWVAVLDRWWLDYVVLETILLYRLGWDFCIVAVLGIGGCSAQVAAYSGFTV